MAAKLIVAAAGSYLIGAIPFSLIMSRLFRGPDIRGAGTGNVGATNVMITTGRKRAGVTAALLDLAKAFFAVILFRSLFGHDLYAYTAGLFSVIGHDFPVYIGFKGGKGVASTLGAVIALSPFAVFPALVLFCGALAASRIFILASVLTISCVPLILFVLGEGMYGIVFGAVFSALALYTHRNDLNRIFSGGEKAINQAADELVV